VRTKHLPDDELRCDDQDVDGVRRVSGKQSAEFPEPTAVSALESPLAIGLLMLVMPPVAVTLAWASPRFGRTAQIALTAYGALVTVVMAVMVAVAMG
jgi:lipopolysaccharide export LptBFGC system permease protein LptF